MDKLISTTELHKIGASISFCNQMRASISPVKHVGYRLYVFLHGDKHVVFKDLPDQVYFPTIETILDVIGGIRNIASHVTLEINNWPGKSVPVGEKRHELSPYPRWTEQPKPCFLTLEESMAF